MAKLYEDKNRKVVPRWRRFSTTLSLGELDHPSREKPPINLPAESFSARLAEWHEHATISYASDLLSCAIVVGKTAEVRKAAEQILSTDRVELAFARGVAERALGLSPKSISEE